MAKIRIQSPLYEGSRLFLFFRVEVIRRSGKKAKFNTRFASGAVIIKRRTCFWSADEVSVSESRALSISNEAEVGTAAMRCLALDGCRSPREQLSGRPPEITGYSRVRWQGPSSVLPPLA
ncbi:hypothetical protein H6P81_012333 [Aristolochia fimbriata]|uniref:Uncharacterized protein n=1 Tax=Aristolochia fimbriata TaxID=158543 RepID=A0AAV7EBI0_ARIFI|nr:hypothetical protein H6P81_012333 [Aristolochia fimbriata]